ncbi:uncharacterized protein B0T15DRAFT_1897 [Chaetomium strumarium]|uniref:Uncharacterized protein n=1 Tax=Chaetomium strumarium TaxID=1170767 RepID=A0AAJ0H053_9PEZI|nr:hypothetical protein B0T15DRAFT_1897 [Chaetomium strumarium]
MAAFDPIEFFGIGHGRDIAIVRHARKQSQSSISLSSACPPTNDALEQSVPQSHWATLMQPSDLNRVPMSPPVYSFVNITPENSLFAATFDLDHAPPSASPNVSIDSSRAFLSIEECPLYRYLGSEERHERLALAFCAEIQTDDKLSTVQIPESCSPFEEQEPGSAGYQSINSASPLHRYLADTLQVHERLAVDLELQSQQQLGGKPSDQEQDQLAADSSISLTPSDGAGLELNNGSVVDMTMEDALTMLHEHRRQRERRAGLARPRIHNTASKRRRGSMPQGHRDKEYRPS